MPNRRTRLSIGHDRLGSNADDASAQAIDDRVQGTVRPISIWTLLALFFIWLVFSFRLISLPFLIAAIWFSRPKSNWLLRYAAWMVLFVAALSPIDIRIPEISHSYNGKPQARIGLVRYVEPGMPRHSWLLTRYGEYYHCAGLPVGFHPRWILSLAVGGLMAEPQLEQERMIANEIRENHGMFEVDEAGFDKPVVLVRFWPAGSEVIGGVLEHLQGLKQLRRLELWDENVTDATLKHIEGLSQLRSLRLWDTQVTDIGLEHLDGLSRLRELKIIGTQVTDQGVKNLQQALPDCKIVKWPHSPNEQRFAAP